MSFLPEGSPYRKAYEAAKVAARGDYKAALSSASSTVSTVLPPNTPFGLALKGASALFSR
jgi:hypothetical protein